MRKKKNVCVIGLGYIGLPTSALLANSGFQVIGVDINPKTVETINRGKIHIVEPDLDSFVHAAVESGNLKAQTTPAEADIFVICVPTPFKTTAANEIPTPDMTYVVSAAKAISPFIKPGNLVILESTSPVGSTELIREIIAGSGIKLDTVGFAYCPERVLPGKIMFELVQNDRIVGGVDKDSTARAVEFYKHFVKGDVIPTDSRTAEMCKLTENSFRDVNIAFANELSMICDKMNINTWDLIRLANRHPRVNILNPGVGVGGHCIAVDPWFIAHAAPQESVLIQSARKVNSSKPHWVISKIEGAVEVLKKQLGREPVVACLGLAFKPNIDDLRESPALEVFNELKTKFKNTVAVEPNVSEPMDSLCTLEEARSKADIYVVLVGHKEFVGFTSEKVVLDFCGALVK